MKMWGLSRVTNLLFGANGDVSQDPEVQVLSVTAAILVTSEVLISPIISDLSGIFGVSESSAGLLMVAIAVPQILLVPAMGIIADRIGRRTIIVPGLLLFGVAGAGVGLTRSFEVAIVLRFLQGVGFAAAMPLSITFLGDLYEGDREATAQAVRQVVINASFIVIPTLAGVLYLVSWRLPFFAFIIAVPVAGWAWYVLPDLAPDEGNTLMNYLSNLVSQLRRPVIVCVLATFVLRFMVLFGFLTYVSVLATHGIGLAVVSVGIVISVKGVFSVIGASQAGRIAARWAPSWVVAVGFALSGVGVVGIGLSTSMATLMAGTVVFSIGDGLIPPIQKNQLNGLTPFAFRAGAMSTANALQNLGKVIGPVSVAFVLGFIAIGPTFVALGVVSGTVGVLTSLAAWRLTD